MEKRVIVDFDNTMGVPGCDVDDALALLFLLGCDDVEVEAVCTTYGNSTIDVVHENTARMLKKLGLDLPLYRGAAASDSPESEASRFLAARAASAPGDLSVLATGSLTNLKGALLADPSFFGNVSEVALMGGITQSLVINGKIMNELNLSCDPAATLAVLSAECPVAVATAQNCLPALFSRGDLENRFGEESWLCRTCDYWFRAMEAAYGYGGFVCWDVVAAAYLVHPELFVRETMDVTLNERLFCVGYLEEASEGAPRASIEVPRIADPFAFVREVMDAWGRALSRLSV